MFDWIYQLKKKKKKKKSVFCYCQENV